MLGEWPDAAGVDPVLGLLDADQASMPWVVQQGEQGRHAQDAVGDGPRTAGDLVS